jgi:hypothetical protein
MQFRLTAREDLHSSGFWWRIAFVSLWFAAVVLVTDAFPNLIAYIFFAVVFAGAILGKLFPKTPLDVLAAIFIGTLAFGMVGGGYMSVLMSHDPHYPLLTSILDLAELSIIPFGAMAFAFWATRYIGVELFNSRGE